MNWYITLNIDEVVKQLKFKGSIEGCLEYITDFLLTYQIMLLLSEFLVLN